MGQEIVGGYIKIKSLIIYPRFFNQGKVSTTQRYLGKVSDNEAIYWIENIYR